MDGLMNTIPRIITFCVPEGNLFHDEKQEGEFGLSQNFPNPFNHQTMVNYILDEEGEILLEVFDMLGRKVEVIADGRQRAGMHEAHWSIGNRSSGTYFLRLTFRGASHSTKSAVRKMIVAK